MKKINLNNEKVWEEFKPQTPPYALRIYSETNNFIKEIQVHGRIMGKLEIKHVRFFDPETETEYIRWNAPSSLRLFIADKDPNKVAAVYAKKEIRKSKSQNVKGEWVNEEKTYFFIQRHVVANKGELD